MKTKTLKKLVSMMMATTLAVGVLSGCGSKPVEDPVSEESTENVENSVEESSEEEEKEPVELEMIVHYDASYVAAIEALNAKFTEEYPWITINLTVTETAQWQQLRETRLTAGDVDIVEVCAFGTEVPEWAIGASKPKNAEFFDNGLIMDLSDQAFMQNWGEVTLANCCTYNGKLYNVPIGLTPTSGIFYNKEIFAEYDLEEPKTWAEFIDICETLKAAGIAPLTVGMKDVWPATMFWNSIAITTIGDIDAWAEGLWTGDAAFNDEASMKVWNKIEQLAPYFEENIALVDYNSVPSRFLGGKAAMMPDGSWTAPALTAADPEFEYGYMPVPGDEAPADGGEAQFFGKYDVGFGGCVKTEHAEEVLLYLEFYSQPENYAEFVGGLGVTSVMPGVETEDEFRASFASKIVDFGIELGYHFFAPAGVGKYGSFAAGPNLAVYGGDVASAKDLADLAQKDFADAVAAVSAE